MESPETSSTTSSRRRYDSSRRQAEALARQQRVIEVATQLFLEQGYGSTSIDQIAKAAGVSAQSVYATFESKAGILMRAIDLARTGDPEGSLRTSAAAAAIRDEQDLAERSRLVARLLRRAYERSARLIGIVERASAMDPVLGELHEHLRTIRRESVEALSTKVSADQLRPGLTRAQALDAMAFLSAAHTYTELVDGFGWSPARYERWLGDALYRLFFDP